MAEGCLLPFFVHEKESPFKRERRFKNSVNNFNLVWQVNLYRVIRQIHFSSCFPHVVNDTFGDEANRAFPAPVLLFDGRNRDFREVNHNDFYWLN